MIFGVDVSQYTPNINWDKVLVANAFVYARATDGLTRDTMHATHMINVVRHGKPFGSYAYGHPSMDVNAFVMAFLTSGVPFKKGYLRLVVDMESLAKGNIVPDNAGPWADQACELIKKITGTEPVIYSSLYYYETMCKQVATLGGPTGWDWWLADYTGSPNQPQVKGLPYIAHQFAGDVPVEGAAEPIDRDVVYADSLDRLLIK